MDESRDAMRALLDGVAVAAHGPQPEGGEWGWAGLPEHVTALRARVAELEAVRWWWCPEHGPVLGAEVHEEDGSLRHRGSEQGDCGCGVTPDEEAWRTARTEGAESMRERAAAVLDGMAALDDERAAEDARVGDERGAVFWRGRATRFRTGAARIRSLPLTESEERDDDARLDRDSLVSAIRMTAKEWRQSAASLRGEVERGECSRQSPEAKLARADVHKVHADQIGRIVAMLIDESEER